MRQNDRLWVYDSVAYEFGGPNRNTMSFVQVSGAMDASPSKPERPMLILEDQRDNGRFSVFNPETLTRCIDSLSNSMGIEPKEADWFVRTKDGLINSVSLSQEPRTVNPRYVELVQSGDLNMQDLAAAKKHFPDVRPLQTEVEPLQAKQFMQLNEAFGENLDRRPEPKLKQERQPEQERPFAKGVDLSQESFPRFDRSQDPEHDRPVEKNPDLAQERTPSFDRSQELDLGR